MAADQLPTPNAILKGSGAPPVVAAPTPLPIDAQWTCRTFSFEKQNQPVDEKMTVGTKFILACEGSPAKLDKTHLGLEIPKPQKYQLHILQTRDVTETRAEFVATAWAAGDFKLSNLVLSDGTTRVGLGEIDIKVTSSLDPQNPQPTPFPPWAPMNLPWPQWIWLSALAVLFVIILALVTRVSRSLRRKRLLKLLDKNPTAMQPFHQFNKDLRKLQRELPMQEANWDSAVSAKYFEELDEMLKWFLARELIVATFDRRPADLARDIRQALIGKDVGDEGKFQRELRITLAELDKARAAKQKLSLADAQQVADLARQLADHVHRAKEGAK